MEAEHVEGDDFVYEVLIIGGGPGGLAAAVYSSRAGRKTLIVERELPGGLVATTDAIENYPGFPETTGIELAEHFREHAQRFGAEIIMDNIEEVTLGRDGIHLARGTSGEYRGKALVVATGSAPRALGVPGEAEFRGRGVSYCATCDAAFFRDRVVACVGGGDSAVQEALFLARLVEKVYIIHRRDELRAVEVLRRRVEATENVEVVWDSVVEEIKGDATVESLGLRNVRTGETSDLPVAGVFIYIGYDPATGFLGEQLPLDTDGSILANEDTTTEVPGVFAVGDVRSKIQRQIATAVGDGATVGKAIELYLESLETE